MAYTQRSTYILEKLEIFKVCIYRLSSLQNPEITWDEEKEKIHILFHYNQIEPVGFMLMGFFLIIVIFQMFGMFAHRLMTLGHIVSSRHIRKFGKKKAINMKKDIEQSGVSIMKDMIQNVEVNKKSL